MSEISHTIPESIVNNLMESHGYTREEAIDICLGAIDRHIEYVESIETKDVE